MMRPSRNDLGCVGGAGPLLPNLEFKNVEAVADEGAEEKATAGGLPRELSIRGFEGVDVS